MTDSELRFPDDRPDETLRRALQPFVAPPGEEYWNTLERRILARLAEERSAWWSVLGEWMRPAAIAAALLLMAATVLLTQVHQADAAIAFNAISEERYPVLEATAQAALPEPAVTLHLMLDH